MLTKDSLRGKFSRDWKSQYQVELFRERGFLRRTCKCGKNFWTLDTERKVCGDPPCEDYGFLGNPITGVRWDYIETWKEFEKFFVKNGHESINRYPVIDRWRPDLFFTIASIQDFQRIDQGNMVFEYPSNPLVVPQVCLRFPDISNVGVTGRHHTSFIMSGQHAFGYPKEGYFKDRCIELNFKFLTKTMKIPETELTYVEDLWNMPDFSAFGPSIETFSRGLELVNSVFMQFTKSGSSYKELSQKVIDVGWGHERLAWFTQGTPTGYDSVFSPVIKWMKKQSGLSDTELFDRYSALSGSLNLTEVKDMKKEKERISRELGISRKKLNEIIEPMQALYAIADHTKTLLFAITDGGIPSNVGGGYNLRVLLRRALSFINEFSFPFSLEKIAELHQKHLKPLFPELSEGLGPFQKIIHVEKERYEKTMEKAGNIIRKELKSGLKTDTMVRLYTSNGITPELIEKIAKKENMEFTVPEDFYDKLTSQHMAGEKDKEEAVKINTTGIPDTELLYYKEPYKREFTGRVIKVMGDWVILDRTLFYPEGGGQPGDSGILKTREDIVRVEDVQRVGAVVIHKARGFKEGEKVTGIIDWERRYGLMKMHTATHIVAGSARKVIGNHIWQAGAKKGLESSRIDLTHYQSFTQDEIEKIEKTANASIRNSLKVEARFMPRGEAEKKYGFVLYQGGASPGKQVRVVRVKGNGSCFDVEACGGMHVNNTKEIDMIKIIKSERIQDGVNRLEFTYGDRTLKFLNKQEDMFIEALTRIEENLEPLKGLISLVRKSGNKPRDMENSSRVFSIEPGKLPSTIEKFSKEIAQNQGEINKLRSEMGLKEKTLDQEDFIKSMFRIRPKTLERLSEIIFEIWKTQRKALEKLKIQTGSRKATMLIKKARGNRVSEIVSGDRKDLINTASEMIRQNPNLTVILSNERGDVVGMSRVEDASRIVKELCEKSGGSGGGNREFAQGRADLSKLLKLKEFKA